MKWKMMPHKNLSSERFLANRTHMPGTNKDDKMLGS
jgi:hypothetical protein